MTLDAAGRLLASVSRNPPLKTWKMLLLFVTELACQKKRHRHTFGQKFEFCSKTLIYKLNSNDVHKVYNFQWNSYLVYALDIIYIILNSKFYNLELFLNVFLSFSPLCAGQLARSFLIQVSFAFFSFPYSPDFPPIFAQLKFASLQLQYEYRVQILSMYLDRSHGCFFYFGADTT